MSQAVASAGKPTYSTGVNVFAMSTRGDLRTIDAPSSLQTVSKSNSTVYSPPLTWLFVSGGGDVAIVGSDDTASVTLVAVPNATFLRISVQQVLSTGTSATNMVGGR